MQKDRIKHLKILVRRISSGVSLVSEFHVRKRSLACEDFLKVSGPEFTTDVPETLHSRHSETQVNLVAFIYTFFMSFSKSINLVSIFFSEIQMQVYTFCLQFLLMTLSLAKSWYQSKGP